MNDITNTDRAERARRLLRHYIEHEMGEVFDPQGVEDMESEIATLIADLRHLCDDEKADFHRACALSYQHHLEEKLEEPA